MTGREENVTGFIGEMFAAEKLEMSTEMLDGVGGLTEIFSTTEQIPTTMISVMTTIAAVMSTTTTTTATVLNAVLNAGEAAAGDAGDQGHPRHFLHPHQQLCCLLPPGRICIPR